MRRCLILDLETSALTPALGDIVRFRAESFSDPDDDFDEWVKPPRPLSAEAEQVIGTTNGRLAQCRPMNVALPDFLEFIDGAELIGDRLDFDLAFLKAAISSAGGAQQQ
jgi:DNA polymerase III alpha subunit (gram-positive type)